MPSSHRSSHTGRSAACRGRSRRRNGVLWEVFPHNQLDEDEDARVGLWARWFFMPSAAEPAPLDAAICPHALALRGVVRSAGWYVPRGWIWPKPGRVSGIAGVCVCWLRALAPNGEHGIHMVENTN